MADHNDVRVVERLLTTGTVRRIVLDIQSKEYTAVIFERADHKWQLDLLPAADRDRLVLRVAVEALPGNDIALDAADYEAMLLAVVRRNAEIFGQAEE